MISKYWYMSFITFSFLFNKTITNDLKKNIMAWWFEVYYLHVGICLLTKLLQITPQHPEFASKWDESTNIYMKLIITWPIFNFWTPSLCCIFKNHFFFIFFCPLKNRGSLRGITNRKYFQIYVPKVDKLVIYIDKIVKNMFGCS